MKHTEKREVWLLFIAEDRGWLGETGGDWGPAHLPRQSPLEARRFHSREAAMDSDAARNWSSAIPQRFTLTITMEKS
jgi:hypothetical protein